MMLEAKQMLEYDVTSGRGGSTLELTPQQHEMLSTEAGNADSRRAIP